MTPGGGNTTVTDDPSPDAPETPSLKAVSAEQQEMLDAFALALDDAPHTTKTIEVINDQYYKAARWTGWKETCLDEDGNLTGYIYDLKSGYVVDGSLWDEKDGETIVPFFTNLRFNKYGRLLSIDEMDEDDNTNLSQITIFDSYYRYNLNNPPYSESKSWYEIAQNDLRRKDDRLEFDETAGGYLREYSYASYNDNTMNVTGTSEYLGNTETDTFSRVVWDQVEHSLEIVRRQRGFSWIPVRIVIDGEEYDPESVTFKN